MDLPNLLSETRGGTLPLPETGIDFKNVEAAYQASKSTDIPTRENFSDLSAVKAKRLGQNIKLRRPWDEVTKVENMELCLRAKFMVPGLRNLLLNTGTSKLTETNHWGDCYWGVYNGHGKNMLGRIIMNIRDSMIAHYSDWNDHLDPPDLSVYKGEV